MSRDTSRRGFLTAAGAGVATALAGCSSGPSEGDGSTSAATETSGSGRGETSDSTEASSSSEEETDPSAETSESTEERTEGTAENTGGTLQLMATGSIQTLDPINAKGSGAGYNQYNQSLMQFPDGLYPPEAALVTDYSMSDDGLTYTFQLKEGVTFHDGAELTASDVVYSYRRLAGSENSRNRDDIIGETMTIEHEKDASIAEPTDEETLTDYVPGSLAVEAVDDYTFRFTLASPFQYTFFQIAGGAFAVLPENAVGDIEGYEGEYGYNEFFSTANGGPEYSALGPFAVDSWTKGSQIRLTAFEDYYGGKPSLDGITYTVVGSGNTRLSRFKSQNADILESIPTPSYDPSSVSIETTNGSRSTGTYAFDDGAEVNYGEVPSLSTEYLVFNCLKVPVPVRKAFAYAMNQDEIAANIYKGTAKPGYHITPPDPYPTFEEGVSGVEAYDRHAESGYQSNTEFGADGYPYGYGETRLDDARAVMEEAGYGENDRYSITGTTISGNAAYNSVFTRLQSKLRSAYIDMSIEQAEFGTIISQAIDGSMEVFGLGDGMEYPGPQNFLRFLHGSNPETQFTRWGAEDSYYTDEYLSTARQAWKENFAADSATQESKKEAFQTVEEMNWASMQELPTVHRTSKRLWHDYVDVGMYGVMENQTFNDVTISR